MEQEQGETIAAFKSSCETKSPRIKERTYNQVNLACYKWLLIQGSENIPINGTILQEKAASDGWLNAWKTRYNN